MFEDYINNHIKIGEKLKNQLTAVERSYEIIKGTLKKNKKIFFAGNGGSAADSDHLTAEFVCKFTTKRKPLKAISLTSNSSIITAQSNDFKFKTIFTRQLSGLSDSGDTVILMSTSGNSENILNCIPLAKKLNLNIIFLTGSNFKNKSLIGKNNVCLKVPSNETAIIQEYHKVIGHYWCKRIDNDFF